MTIISIFYHNHRLLLTSTTNGNATEN